MEKINSIWEKYTKIEIIGINSFSKVYKAKNKITNQYVVIKEIQKPKINIQNFLKGIENWKRIKKDNSVEIIDKFETKEYYYLIIESCYISLDDYLKMRKDPFSIEEIKEILLEVNKCFKEMKEKKINHENLKLSNILLSLNKSNINKICFKISDFGLSNFLKESKMNKMSSNENAITISPEILKGEENLITDKSDIWSLGIIIYYMLFKEYPYNGNEYQIINEIESKKELKTINNEKLDDLIKKMLVKNINERISWEEYFDHPFFNSNLSVLKCKKHSKDFIGYCPKCKHNVCIICFHEHSSKNHKVILSNEIKFSENEIKQIDDLKNQIENNIKKYLEIKEEIRKFIDNVKLIKENKLIYNNENENNFKNYTIEYLKIIKDKLKLDEEINHPLIPKWGYRYINYE